MSIRHLRLSVLPTCLQGSWCSARMRGRSITTRIKPVSYTHLDGGFSKAYQKDTGIAGYTLIYNSYGLILAAHEPFESTEAAIEKESDIHSDSTIVKRVIARKTVGDTDIGRELKKRIEDLAWLLESYREGIIAEKI